MSGSLTKKVLQFERFIAGEDRNRARR